MESDTAAVWVLFLFAVLTVGSPDLLDAIIHFLMP